MLGVFGIILDLLRNKPGKICIDNWIFKLHYRATVIIFILFTILVTLTEYFGDRIKCITDTNFSHVIETYCFSIASTFTIVSKTIYLFSKLLLCFSQEEYFDVSLVKQGHIPHLGVGPYGLGSKKTLRHHHYYQWVPFLLFIQAIMFYLTHLLWKNLEASRLQKLIDGLNNSAYAIMDKELIVNNQMIPTKEAKTEWLTRIKHNFLEQISANKSWTISLFACELLNVLHVVLQIFITHMFLGKQFFHLGFNVLKHGYTILDQVFPKVTKCIFHKYGGSGSIETHDTLCIMGLNVIIEKIYLFIWIWFLVLFAVSCSILVWRVLCFFCLSKSLWFNQIIFGRGKRGHFSFWQINTVVKHFSYPDWLFLKYIAKNLNSLAFRELFLGIFEELEEKKTPSYAFVYNGKEEEKRKPT